MTSDNFGIESDRINSTGLILERLIKISCDFDLHYHNKMKSSNINNIYNHAIELDDCYIKSINLPIFNPKQIKFCNDNIDNFNNNNNLY